MLFRPCRRFRHDQPEIEFLSATQFSGLPTSVDFSYSYRMILNTLINPLPALFAERRFGFDAAVHFGQIGCAQDVLRSVILAGPAAENRANPALSALIIGL